MAEGHSFSQRHGIAPLAAQITIRYGAPDVLRGVLADRACDALGPKEARRVVCGVLPAAPDPNNWTEYPNVYEEVVRLLQDCPWNKVYDVAEAVHARIEQRDWLRAGAFEGVLNELFFVHGIGWRMERGMLIARGSEPFEVASREAVAELRGGGRPTASDEVRQAMMDISRRPEPDVTGAVQHAMAALECVARDVAGAPSSSLGQLVDGLGLPKPLDEAVKKAWGFASQQGRHLREGGAPAFEEAELVVTIASAIALFLHRRGAPA